MKHFPDPHTSLLSDLLNDPRLRPMTDADWEKYIHQRSQEEADHFNATAHLLENLRVSI